MNLLNRKRIVFIFGCLDLGGSERQGFQLARYLKEQCAADVHILGLSDRPGRLSELCDEHGIPWHGMKFHWSGFWPLRLKELGRLVTKLRQLSPDVLLPYYTLPNTACGLIWRRTGARLAVWNQRDEGLLLTRNIWHRSAVSRTPLFIANSEGGRDFLVRTYGIGSGRVAVIHNGIALAPPKKGRSEWRSALGIAAETFVGCMVANLGPYKDHESLLRAWRIVSAEASMTGKEAVLVLAGTPDGSEERLKGLASELSLDGAVHFVGRMDDVASLLTASDICVHSSWTEGLPNAVLEAMAAGLPVVGTDIPGLQEAVGPVGAPYLVPVGDAGAMAERILTFFRDPQLRKRVGDALQKRVGEEFNLDRMCGETAQVLAEGLRKCPAK